jgi:hypothetical protein
MDPKDPSMNLIKTSSLLLAMAAGVASASGRAPESTDVPVRLSGTWKLNKELSDDPMAKMMEARRSGSGHPEGRGGGRGGMGAPRGGGGGGGGMGGGPPGGGMGGPSGGRGPGGAPLGGEPPLDGTTVPEGRREENRQGQDPTHGPRPAMGFAASPQFAIEQEGTNLAFRTESNLRLLRADGEKRKKEGDHGRFDVIAKFVKGSLVIETRPENGGKRKETYTLEAEDRLKVEFDVEGSGPMPALRFKLVYDAAPRDAGPGARF